MKPSENCINFIKKQEQLELKAYKDQTGLPTIGYGTIIYADGSHVKMGDIITEENANKYLMIEVVEKSTCVNTYLKGVNLTQGIYDSLVDFCYNEGCGALQKSTLLKKIKKYPNDPTMLSLNDVVPAVFNWMEKKNLTEINTIHHEFMQYVFAKNPKTGKKEISFGLQVRRNAEYQMYKA